MRSLLSVALAALALATATCTNIAFVCSTDAECVRGEAAPGFCEANNRCSFPDDTCEVTQRRFAPSGTAEACVPPPPMCTIDGVTAGVGFTCAWSNAGRVACWGDNGSNQLGDAGLPRSVPKKMEVSNVREVVAGAAHVCARHADGTVSCWGDNSGPQLGDGMTATPRPAPVKVEGLDKVAALAAGTRHTCARREDGSVACWGRNDRGQIGDGTTTTRPRATAVLALKKDALQIVAGDAHTCALLTGGRIACWGLNRSGALGVAPETTMQLAPAIVTRMPAALHLAAGDSHTCATAATGEVWCWGANDQGQAGDRGLGRAVDPIVVGGIAGAGDIEAGSNHTCALQGGRLSCWGGSAFGQLSGPAGPDSTLVNVPDKGWRRVAAGGRHTCAVTNAGEVHCWGRLADGQLGDGVTINFGAADAQVTAGEPLAALAAGGSHTCAVTRAKRVICWGRGESGQLGNGELSASSQPVAVELPADAEQVVAGTEFSCARLVDGSIHCWGRGNRGQLGNRSVQDQPRPVLVGPLTPEKAVQLAAGPEHACAVTDTGAIHCWGETQSNRLGNGVTAGGPQSKTTRVLAQGDFVQVTLGMGHGCALTRTGIAHCWGLSTYGQTSVGLVSTPAPPTPVPLPDVKVIVAGHDHTCALTGAQIVYCWGRGDNGQVGWGTISPGIALPVRIENFRNVVGLASGISHSCAVQASGAAFCWGNNRHGQLGVGAPGASRNMPAAVTKLPPEVASIDAGERHTCALLRDGRAFCWGLNQNGQLGMGAPLERAEPMKVDLPCP